MSQKTIYLLLGPKGSGKSHIGTVLEKEFKIPFVLVEPWAKNVKQELGWSKEQNLERVFQVIESGVRKALVSQNQIAFESTGLTRYFDRMLVNLKKDFDVVMIKVVTDPKLCLSRIATRDQSIHISFSEEEIKEINEMVFEKDLKTDFVLDNNVLDQEGLIDQLEQIINASSNRRISF